MKKLEESGLSIGDFAMSLMESKEISPKNSSSSKFVNDSGTPPELDISNIKVSDSMVGEVIQESFGLKDNLPKKDLLSEQEILQEKITSLKSELVETINKLTSLVSEAAMMAENFTSCVGGVGPPNFSGGKKVSKRKRVRRSGYNPSP